MENSIVTSSASRISFYRRIVFTILLGLALAGLLQPRPAGAVPPPQRQCNLTGQPGCPSPVPAQRTTYNVSFWGNSAPNDSFHSLADTISWIETLAPAGHPGGWCSINYQNTTSPDPAWGGPTYQNGIVYQNSYLEYFDVTAFQGQGTPDCQQNWSTSGSVLTYTYQICPDPLTVAYSAQPVVGPYCAGPSQPQYVKPKAVGPCCTSSAGGENSGGADGNSSRTVVGDPVDVSDGNNYYSEVDYEGGSADSLKFTRSYNSLLAYTYKYGAGGSGSMSRLMPLGIAWSATYFQSLQIVSATDSTGTHVSVYAFRPGGRLIIFNLFNGVYNPDADVADNLIATDSGYQYVTADDTVETYDTGGHLLSIVPRGQSGVTLTYGTLSAYTLASDTFPLSVSDAFGHTLQFSYIQDTNGYVRLGSITDPAGNTITYTYDGNNNLISVQHQDGTTRGYAYESNNGSAMYQLTDEAGIIYASWNYDSLGAVVTSSQLAGGVEYYQYQYLANGGRTIIDPLNNSRTYGQQPIWGVYRATTASSICPGCGEDSSRSYDANGNISLRADFNGNQTTYLYDQNRNLETSRTEASGTAMARTITTVWDPSYRQPDTITEPNRTSAWSYDSTGNVLTKTITDTSTTPNVSRTWTYTYDSYGRVLTADGPRTDISDVSRYTYYTCASGFECGQVKTVTDAAGNVTTYDSYDAHGNPLSITDPNGVLTTLVYDARMRLTSRTTGGETTAFAYYPIGLLQAATLPDGSTVRYTYDGAHRLIRIADGAGNSLQYSLDAMGNHIGESAYDPNNVLGHALSRVYNSLNELSQTVGAAGTAAVTTTYGYDSNGNQTSVAAPLGRNTAETFDALNRLSKITDPNNGNTQLTYDANDNLSAVKDPLGLVTSYNYDGFGDLLSQVSPGTGTTVNTYDSGGNLFTSQDARGVTVQYSYDALNRVTQAAYGDQTIFYYYDAGFNGRGRLTSASDGNHSLVWQYDALGRVIEKTQTVGSVTRLVGYAYSNGDMVTLTTPSGQSVSYTYSNNQVTSVTVNGNPLLSNVSYDPFGPIRGWSWGNETTEARLYDADGNPEQFTGAEATSYTVDSAFRITAITNAANSGFSWTYSYDNLDRIASGANTASALGWTYDADGNRATANGAPNPAYSSPSLTLGYNNRGRLSGVTSPSATTTYLYNALGQRIQKTTGNTTTVFVYDEVGHLLGEYDGSGTLIEETIWLGGLPVATLQPNGTGGVNIFYIHADHLGAPKAITRPADNAIVWRWDQDPFGTAAPNQNPAGLGTFVYNPRFPGQYYDVETGLSYNVWRDYDAATGRYVEGDPLGLEGGLDLYGYVDSNPVSFSDPFGLQSPAACANPANFAACEAAGVISQQAAKNAAKAAAAAAAATAAAATSGDSGCCKQYKLVYEPNPKHRKNRYYFRGVSVAREPTAGPLVLQASIPTGSPSERRVGYDPVNSELIVFPLTRTDPVNCIKYYHGWVAEYYDDVYGRNDIINSVNQAGWPKPW